MFDFPPLRKNCTSLLIAAILVCVTPAHSHAQTALGARDLYEICTSTDIDWIAFCAGFVQAANDQAVLSGQSCAPAGTTRAEMIDAFLSFDTAEVAIGTDLEGTIGLSVAIAAVSDAYPCN